MDPRRVMSSSLVPLRTHRVGVTMHDVGATKRPLVGVVEAERRFQPVVFRYWSRKTISAASLTSLSSKIVVFVEMISEWTKDEEFTR
ncbi:hypothetical protein TNCV_3788051 [Trichonephila clavipes]|nr:hypothetical protein TNCV_3788051 [Trichonephila clavipes]